MQSNTPSNPTPPLQEVLDIIDKVTEAKGLSVLQIVDIEKLRTLPSGAFGRTWAHFVDEQNLKPFTTGSRRKQLQSGHSGYNRLWYRPYW